MSCMIASDRHIVVIADNIFREKYTGSQGGYTSVEESAQLCQEMYRLNCEAYNARYPQEDLNIPDLTDWFEKLVVRNKERPTLVEYIKLLDFYLYQCNEGEAYASCSLYRRLQSARGQAVIVALGDEWKKAPWGIV